MNNSLPKSSQKQQPDFSNFRGEDALYSRMMQGLVDTLDEIPYKIRSLKFKIYSIKEEIAYILGL